MQQQQKLTKGNKSDMLWLFLVSVRWPGSIRTNCMSVSMSAIFRILELTVDTSATANPISVQWNSQRNKIIVFVVFTFLRRNWCIRPSECVENDKTKISFIVLLAAINMLQIQRYDFQRKKILCRLVVDAGCCLTQCTHTICMFCQRISPSQTTITMPFDIDNTFMTFKRFRFVPSTHAVSAFYDRVRPCRFGYKQYTWMTTTEKRQMKL